ncbi:MAG: MFS transporter [Planctomycetes bacterium]|nr:MFS transporter [Planctomycetota bacterium]
MSYQPAENLTNRTFVGLIVAQFLAGFNDQAIHAAAMFYAMHTKILSQANAITLMPILFYAPWAIFCTLAGHYADRYSKTLTLRLWKVSEIVISILLIAGFYFGSNAGMPYLGGWLVMSSVFLMGTHAAFFAPAKYGAMPEILRPHILSRGNGILESTTFLASIFGSVSGGLLFNMFRDDPVWIGVVLLVLSVIGAAASFLIAWLPAASPEKLFPVNLFKPLQENLKVMFRSRPLALTMFGIAFFIFMVAYMRASMYMHGETRNPRWDEEQTSLIVATVALGVGLGSPLAGYLSGGKVELGLVPLGCLGMIFALVTAAVAIEHTAVLVVALVIIGFFSGFYMVPLYTLLQQRAPKKSKGELVATSNFINVTGAIAASILFKVLVLLSQVSGLTPEVPVVDEVIVGVVQEIKLDKHSKIQRVVIKPDLDEEQKLQEEYGIEVEIEQVVIDTNETLLEGLSGVPKAGDRVVVSSYTLRNRLHYVIRPADHPVVAVYDTGRLPSYLFFGAALMTVGILIMLCRALPDFFVRSLFWFKSLGKYRLKAVGMQNLPTDGPVILATNCKDLVSCLQLVSVTDRTTKVVLIDDPAALHDGVVLRGLAGRANLILVKPGDNGNTGWTAAERRALEALRGGHLLAISLDHMEHAGAIARLVHDLQKQTGAPILPVYCGSIDDGATGGTPRIRVVFGDIIKPAAALAPAEAIQAGVLSEAAVQQGTVPLVELAEVNACKESIVKLGEWIRLNDDSAGSMQH